MGAKRDLVDVLHEAKVFYLATANAEPEGKPHVRPFDAVVRYDGKAWFCTGKWKDVYAHMQANASIEISSTIDSVLEGYHNEIEIAAVSGCYADDCVEYNGDTTCIGGYKSDGMELCAESTELYARGLVQR